MNEGIKLRGLIKIDLIRDGKLIDTREIKNTITTAGLAEVANLCGNVASPAYFTYLALGLGTVAASSANTTLGSEILDSGLERASATVSRVTTTATNDTLQLLKEWTASGVKAVTECGAFNDATTGEMLGRQVFAAINTVSGDTVQVTYKFIFA